MRYEMRCGIRWEFGMLCLMAAVHAPPNFRISGFWGFKRCCKIISRILFAHRPLNSARRDEFGALMLHLQRESTFWQIVSSLRSLARDSIFGTASAEFCINCRYTCHFKIHLRYIGYSIRNGLTDFFEIWYATMEILQAFGFIHHKPFFVFKVRGQLAFF